MAIVIDLQSTTSSQIATGFNAVATALDKVQNGIDKITKSLAEMTKAITGLNNATKGLNEGPDAKDKKGKGKEGKSKGGKQSKDDKEPKSLPSRVLEAGKQGHEWVKTLSDDKKDIDKFVKGYKDTKGGEGLKGLATSIFGGLKSLLGGGEAVVGGLGAAALAEELGAVSIAVGALGVTAGVVAVVFGGVAIEAKRVADAFKEIAGPSAKKENSGSQASAHAGVSGRVQIHNQVKPLTEDEKNARQHPTTHRFGQAIIDLEKGVGHAVYNGMSAGMEGAARWLDKQFQPYKKIFGAGAANGVAASAATNKNDYSKAIGSNTVALNKLTSAIERFLTAGGKQNAGGPFNAKDAAQRNANTLVGAHGR